MGEFERSLTDLGSKMTEQETKVAVHETKLTEQEEKVADIAEDPVLVKLRVSALHPNLTPFSGSEESFLITGGFDGSTVASTEVFPNSPGCSLPPLPQTRSAPATFLVLEPTPAIACCGGFLTDKLTDPLSSCLVLDRENHRWNEIRMGDLTIPRKHSAVVSLHFVGVYILGGYGSGYVKWKTSDFLATGWKRRK